MLEVAVFYIVESALLGAAFFFGLHLVLAVAGIRSGWGRMLKWFLCIFMFVVFCDVLLVNYMGPENIVLHKLSLFVLASGVFSRFFVFCVVRKNPAK